ncbi:hypothetical protein IWZ01DRAFT_511787 [Phyllosticta capitalensis]
MVGRCCACRLSVWWRLGGRGYFREQNNQNNRIDFTRASKQTPSLKYPATTAIEMTLDPSCVKRSIKSKSPHRPGDLGARQLCPHPPTMCVVDSEVTRRPSYISNNSRQIGKQASPSFCPSTASGQSAPDSCAPTSLRIISAFAGPHNGTYMYERRCLFGAALGASHAASSQRQYYMYGLFSQLTSNLIGSVRSIKTCCPSANVQQRRKEGHDINQRHKSDLILVYCLGKVL